MSVARGFKVLGFVILVYVVVGMVLSGTGAVKFALPSPPPPPSSGNPLDYVRYGFSVLVYPFQVLGAVLGVAVAVMSFSFLPEPFSTLFAGLVLVLLVYAVIEILLAVIGRLPVPVPV